MNNIRTLRFAKRNLTAYGALALGVMSSLLGTAHAQTTYTFGASAAGTYDWAAGTNWSASAPVGGAGTTLNYSGSPAMAAGANIVSNNNIAGNFLLNRLSFATAGTTTAGTLTLQGSQLEFVNNGGTAPTLNVNMGGTNPALTINNNILLTNSLSVNVNNAFTIGGVISGGGDFIKANTSTATLSLTGANTYTGATTLGVVGSAASANVLTVSGANGSISGSTGISINGSGSQLNLDYVGVADGAVNRVGNTTAVTLGTGGELRMNGATAAATSSSESIGTLTLGTGTGIVTINNGGSGASTDTLTASGFSRGSSFATALVRGSSLGLTANANSRLILTSQSGLTQIGTATSSSGVDTGTVKNLTIVPYLVGATSASSVGSNFVTYDTLTGLRRLGTNEASAISSGAAGDNVRTVAGANAVTGAKVFNSVLLSSGGTGATPGTATSSVTGDGNSLTITSGALANVATGANGNVTVSGFSSIIFGTTGANEAVITNTNVTAGGSLTIASPIDTANPGGGLTKTGAGLVILSANNLYTGATTINQGSLQIGNGTTGNLNATGTVTVNPQGTLTLNMSDGSTIGNAVVLNGNANITRAAATTNINSLSGGISGSGGITLNQAGTFLGLSGTQSTNTGSTTITNGTLRVTGNVLSASSALVLNPTDNTGNSTLQLRADTNTTFQNASAAFASVTGGASRAITLNVDQATSGNSGKILTVGGNFTIRGYQNNINTINITGNNGYGLALGPVVGSSHDSGGGTINFNVTTPGGLTIGSLDMTSGQTVYGFTGSANTVITGNLIRTNLSPSFTVSQSGSGELTLQGAATTTTSTNQGGYVFNLSGGKLNVNNAAALGDGNAVADAAYRREINLSGGTLDNTSGSAIVVSNNRAAVSATNSFITNINGNFAFGGSNALQLNVGTGTGSGTGIAQRGFITLGTTAAGGGARTITANGSAPLTLNGAIVNGGGTSPTASSITKEGTGTLALGQSNFYTGGTTVSDGILEVNGDNVVAQTALAGTRVVSGATTTISAMNPAAVANLRVGQAVTGTGIAAGTVVSGKLSATSIAISQAPSAASTVADLAFTAGGGLGTGAVAVNGGTLLVNSTGNINGTTGVTVSGGTFRYNGTSALDRNVTLNGGNFSYNSSNNYTGALTFTSGTIGGSNISNLDLTIGTGQTMSPGNSTGTMAAGATTWANGGTFLFELNDATGTAGSTSAGWDLLNATSLNITAVANQFTIQIASLDSLQAAGLALNFNDATNYNWLFVDTASSITSFNAAAFSFLDSFNNTTTGTFGIARGDTISGGDATQLYITYSAIPEPSTYAMLLGGLGLLAFLRRRSKS
jgi:autotransporter-associated beta strand protein